MQIDFENMGGDEQLAETIYELAYYLNLAVSLANEQGMVTENYYGNNTFRTKYSALKLYVSKYKEYEDYYRET